MLKDTFVLREVSSTIWLSPDWSLAQTHPQVALSKQLRLEASCTRHCRFFKLLQSVLKEEQQCTNTNSHCAELLQKIKLNDYGSHDHSVLGIQKWLAARQMSVYICFLQIFFFSFVFYLSFNLDLIFLVWNTCCKFLFYIHESKVIVGNI